MREANILDPNECLREILSLATDLEENSDNLDVSALALEIKALDRWLATGGFLPNRWVDSRPKAERAERTAKPCKVFQALEDLDEKGSTRHLGYFFRETEAWDAVKGKGQDGQVRERHVILAGGQAYLLADEKPLIVMRDFKETLRRQALAKLTSEEAAALGLSPSPASSEQELETGTSSERDTLRGCSLSDLL